MAKFTKLAGGVWGVRLTPEEAVTASSDDQVTVTKQDGTTKVVTLAGLFEQKTTPGGALVHEDWSIREERPVSAYRGRGRAAYRREYAGASLASQTAPYDLAEPRPAPAPADFPADPNDTGAWFAPGSDDQDLAAPLIAPIVRRGGQFYDRTGWFVLPRPAVAVAVAAPLGYADAMLFAAEYEADEDVWPNLLSRPTLLVGVESTLTRE